MKQEVDININISIDAPGANKMPQNSDLKMIESAPAEKLKVNLSVPQLAYIFRVLTDLEIIESQNISEVIRFLAKNISTPNAEDISVDSLRGRFYKPTQSAKQFTHDLIMKQLNHIRKELKKA